MQHPAPLDQLPAAARKALSGPPPLRAMVARGLAPLPPAALVSALYALTYDPDEKLATSARESLAKLPSAVIDGAMASVDLPAAVLDDLGERFAARPDFDARVVQHAQTASETLERIAARANEELCELMAVNEARLLAHPAIIEALYLNRALRMSTADRLVELAARNGVTLAIPGFEEIVASLQNQLLPEPGEVTPADEMFRDALAEATDEEALLAADEDVVDRDENGEEEVKARFKKASRTLADMSTSEKIRMALIGTPAQRMLLVRSANRMVAMAAVTSPRAQEAEAVSVSGSRQVGEEILRYVANRRDWVRIHQVKLNLCYNPKTPVATSMRLLPHLRENDLKSLSRSRNVPQALKGAVLQLLAKRNPTQGG